MKRDNWIVGEYSVRPAGKPDECFYCNEKVGDPHKLDCVIRDRTFVVDVTIRMAVARPDSWSVEDIEQFFNASGWCAGNIVDDLHRLQDVTFCLCEFTTVKFVREATEEDEDKYGIHVRDSES